MLSTFNSTTSYDTDTRFHPGMFLHPESDAIQMLMQAVDWESMVRAVVSVCASFDARAYVRPEVFGSRCAVFVQDVEQALRIEEKKPRARDTSSSSPIFSAKALRYVAQKYVAQAVSDIRRVLRAHFADAKSVIVDLYYDPEAQEEPRILATVGTTLRPTEFLDRQERFYEESCSTLPESLSQILLVHPRFI